MKVELRHIHKHFGKVHANDDIVLEVPSGAIQGILGENGAGKSTLMKALSGFILADSGEILLDDKPISLHSPADAIRNGIGMLHQDPLDFPPMKLVDNFLLGRPGSLFPDRKAVARDINELASQFGFSLDPEAYVDSLTVGERQQLEILRLLWLGARVLILDEPTTGISANQKTKLFETLRKLAQQGVTVIFVSHKLEDVAVLCHRVAILRAGKLVGETTVPFESNKVVAMMFGKEIALGSRNPVKPGPAVLELRDLAIEGVRLEISGVNLEARAGEVIGLAGMAGSGEGPFIRACAGLIRPVNGRVVVAGRDLTGKSYHAFKECGVSFLPASRMEEGLIPGLTLTEHFVLAEEPEGMFIDREKGAQLAEERIKSFNIRGTPVSTVESLSGGNQQRALLALLRTPLSLILLEHPTRGLDVESAIYIWSKLKGRCKQGTSIIFISSDLEEILQYSDRVLVFFSGKVSPPLNAESLTTEKLGELIGGIGWANLKAEKPA
ncbi:MAG TPA: ATP-binding cassette domain-containing protein [Anaerolineales bacterium]|nr:ATP-binding cassette domain-containing protein [Anaerolineales bacterium]